MRIIDWTVNDHDHYGRTPLHLAACLGNEKIFNYLVYNGADLTSLDAFENDPI